MESEKEAHLHVVMFPWLAMGHIIPFFHLSNCFAQRGHKVTFISTPKNLQRLNYKNTPSDLINIVSLPLPKVENLPDGAESSMDIPYQNAQKLKIAFDLLKAPLTTFLENQTSTLNKPDWIIYDYASHWLPQIAHNLGISCAFFSLFNSATMAFWGPPSALLNDQRSVLDDYTVVPNWIPFHSNIKYRLHEIAKNFEAPGDESGASDKIRFGTSIHESDVILFRTCVEFEPEWFNLVSELFKKPLLSVGVLPPCVEKEDSDTWVNIRNWLDERKQGSVVYVALGTEATVSRNELNELALGLEKCGLPFFWVIRKQEESHEMQLPEDYEVRVKNKGMIHRGWVPQAKILSHPSIGGFLSHCGWNSVIEAMCFGRVLIMFPVMNDQGLNVRLLEEKGVGIEIPRNEKDGAFDSDSVAEIVRFAVVSQEGQPLRANVKRVSALFGDRDGNERLVDDCLAYFMEHKHIG